VKAPKLPSRWPKLAPGERKSGFRSMSARVVLWEGLSPAEMASRLDDQAAEQARKWNLVIMGVGGVHLRWSSKLGAESLSRTYWVALRGHPGTHVPTFEERKR
jgi:hypothetical protein